jgi:proteasome assembly chaperone (PAC2) family protein
VGLYRLETSIDALVAPVLVAAFDGWVDAAGAASAAATRLAADAQVIATFEPDLLFDYRSRRPVLDIIDGTPTGLDWPSLAIRKTTAGGRDLLILHGAEPDFRWRELGEDLLELCLSLGVVEWVSLGAIPAAVPHTRPVGVLATATSDDLLHEDETKGPPGLLRVPGACLSAVEMSVTGSGIPAVGFFAQVPHYVAGPFTPATLALLRHLSRHLHFELGLDDLEKEADSQRERLDALVGSDDEIREALERLEEANDAEIPSGDQLAAEIERYLRNRGTGEGGGTIPPTG